MLSNYDYNLPPELMAHEPANPRDSARLFVYDVAADRVIFDIFANLAKYVPPKSLLVLNDTRVVPSRLTLTKKTGGAVIILFLMNEWDGGVAIKGLPDKGVKVGESLFVGGIDDPARKAVIEVVSNHDEEFTYKLLVNQAEFRKIIELNGKTPLPPYIHSGLSENELRDRYQTSFAKVSNAASVAAPTASLHFTDRVFKSLESIGVETAKVTLHVGRGTFSPVTQDMTSKGSLHSEPLYISDATSVKILAAKQNKNTVIAAGTTSLRAIESAAPQILAGVGFSGDTDIFIKPPYDFRVAGGLITNFHLPGTSLLMLLDAFLRHKGAKKSWGELYSIAIDEKFRFYSFGDAMLII